ncbi:MAG: DUF1835 domain-containing protein [Rickettsia endosymbiont of Pentastiridius leporinus]
MSSLDGYMIIHIVSGYSACATLKYALHNLVQPKENSNSIIINHFDDLSIGPLCDIDTTNATIRAEFWEKIYATM